MMESSAARPGRPTGPASPWIKCPQPRPAASLRLVCFPHAGGTASVYHQWGTMIDREIEVWAIELPGHGSRIREVPESRLETAAAAITRELLATGLTDRPFACFGHSMGGLLAFEVVRALPPSPLLRHFFASGCHAPQLDFDDPPIHALPRDDFFAVMVERYGGIPEAILREKELLELILPTLRADMQMIETHRHASGPPLACPITTLAGHDDRRATPEVLGGWKAQTIATFELLRFTGGHFYLQNNAREVIGAIESRLLNGSHHPSSR